MIERDFDVPFVADLALREKQIQQNYRPIMAVHKWFARRPGTLFRALILSEFVEKPLRESFYQGQSLKGLKVLDPFMGGGTTLVEANRVGCAVTGFDINPMAWWIVRQEIGELDLEAYRRAADELRTALETEIGSLYRTRCLECGAEDAHVKYFLWVKSIPCKACKGRWTCFPTTSSPRTSGTRPTSLSAGSAASYTTAGPAGNQGRAHTAGSTSPWNSRPVATAASASIADLRTTIPSPSRSSPSPAVRHRIPLRTVPCRNTKDVSSRSRTR